MEKKSHQTYTSKSHSYSQGTLPRTVLSLDETDSYSTDMQQQQTYGRSMSSSSAYSSGVVSPTMKTSTTTISEEARRATLKDLNNRLVTYIEKVRLLQQATDVWDSISRQSEGATSNVHVIKTQFEAEISDWRAKYEEILSELNRVNIETGNVKQDNKQLKAKLTEKAAVLRDREASLGSMEAEIAELLSKLNILQNEKGRLGENEQLLRSELERAQSEIETVRRGHDKEKHRSADLEAKLRALEQELGFKLQMVEKELEEERKRGRFDLSAIDEKLKGEYESRLRAELKKLRKMYEEQTAKARSEYMTVHSQQLAELQELLSRERSNNNSAGIELQDVLNTIDGYKRSISELEKAKLSLSSNVTELSQNLKEQGATFRAQLIAKDKEIALLQERIVIDRFEYEKLIKVKHDLDLEIEIYRSIIDSEIERFRKVSEPYMKVDMKKDSSDSSSDEEKRGKDMMDGGRRVTKQRVVTSSKTSRYSKNFS